MEFVRNALRLTAMSDRVKVIPLKPLSKLPAIKDFTKEATRDPVKIEWWGRRFPGANVGVSTENLIAVDVDNKTHKGSEVIARLASEGKNLPDTLTQETPTHGSHHIFAPEAPMKQGVNVLGPGVDIRARGGYVVGAGSRLPNGVYTISKSAPIAKAPKWLVDICGQSNVTPINSPTRSLRETITRRALEFLSTAPFAVQGEGGDATTYKVVCQLKDLGVDEPECLELLASFWTDKCSPPWPIEVLKLKVANGYRYGTREVGAEAPEIQFTPVTEDGTKLHPCLRFNESCAYIGGEHDFVLREMKDHKNRPITIYQDVEAFNRDFASFKIDGKQATKIWMQHPSRRKFNGLCLMPGEQPANNFYNLWRGFAVTPLPPDEKPSQEAKTALDKFLDHTRTNVCNGDSELSTWLISFFAHMVQCPWEKPNVAIVMKGRKGVGKNALVERIKYLFGNHAVTLSDRNHLIGNFNAHLEGKIFAILDEAFWSGDKAAEGKLKYLITGPTQTIERKGHDPYETESCLRVAILSNEDWVVPATDDERRYAVFQVGEGRMQDLDFFQSMREGMEAGGYRLLMRYLMDFQIPKHVNVKRAPNTEALEDQKDMSRTPLQEWWFECLNSQQIVDSDFQGIWPTEVPKETVRSAFQRYVRGRSIHSRIPAANHFTRDLKKVCPPLVSTQAREGNIFTQVYRLPTIDEARQAWASTTKQKPRWETRTEIEELLT